MKTRSIVGHTTDVRQTFISVRYWKKRNPTFGRSYVPGGWIELHLNYGAVTFVLAI